MSTSLFISGMFSFLDETRINGDLQFLRDEGGVLVFSVKKEGANRERVFKFERSVRGGLGKLLSIEHIEEESEPSPQKLIGGGVIVSCTKTTTQTMVFEMNDHFERSIPFSLLAHMNELAAKAEQITGDQEKSSDENSFPSPLYSVNSPFVPSVTVVTTVVDPHLSEALKLLEEAFPEIEGVMLQTQKDFERFKDYERFAEEKDEIHRQLEEWIERYKALKKSFEAREAFPLYVVNTETRPEEQTEKQHLNALGLLTEEQIEHVRSWDPKLNKEGE